MTRKLSGTGADVEQGPEDKSEEDQGDANPEESSQFDPQPVPSPVAAVSGLGSKQPTQEQPLNVKARIRLQGRLQKTSSCNTV